MAVHTGIQWTDATWNPIRGCSRVSEACIHCYAEAVAARFSGPGQAYEGLARRRSNGEPQWTGEVRVIEEHMLDPIRWRRPRRIFVDSMSDLFHEHVSDETIDRVFAVMALAPRHTFQILTKRPQRMREYISTGGRRGAIAGEAHFISQADRRVLPVVRADGDWPFPNVWLGVSVEHQAAADERIPLLLDTPAAVRFVSCEPLLGRVSLVPTALGGYPESDWFAAHGPNTPRIDWVIVGGESGRAAREFDLAWARSILQQCKAANVACFIKQLGRRPAVANDDYSERWPGASLPIANDYQPYCQGELAPLRFADSHGGDMAEWPEDLRVREFPEART